MSKNRGSISKIFQLKQKRSGARPWPAWVKISGPNVLQDLPRISQNLSPYLENSRFNAFLICDYQKSMYAMAYTAHMVAGPLHMDAVVLIFGNGAYYFECLFSKIRFTYVSAVKNKNLNWIESHYLGHWYKPYAKYDININFFVAFPHLRMKALTVWLSFCIITATFSREIQRIDFDIIPNEQKR